MIGFLSTGYLIPLFGLFQEERLTHTRSRISEINELIDNAAREADPRHEWDRPPFPEEEAVEALVASTAMIEKSIIVLNTAIKLFFSLIPLAFGFVSIFAQMVV